MEARHMEIAVLVLSILSLSLFMLFISVSKKLRAVSDSFAELIISSKFKQDNPLLYKQEQEIHQENFIKFLSDSREWAFSYIENVQQGLKKFIQEVEPQIEYYDNYGAVLEGMIAPHDFALKKISTELKELKKLLPEDIKDDRR